MISGKTHFYLLVKISSEGWFAVEITNCYNVVNFALLCLYSYLKLLLALTAWTNSSGLTVAGAIGRLTCISVDVPALGEPMVISSEVCMV